MLAEAEKFRANQASHAAQVALKRQRSAETNPTNLSSPAKRTMNDAAKLQRYSDMARASLFRTVMNGG